MNDHVTIRVFEILGSGLCVASDDGQKVHDQIAQALRNNRKAQLSFMNIESLTQPS
jgi:spore maturation protein CgeB